MRSKYSFFSCPAMALDISKKRSGIRRSGAESGSEQRSMRIEEIKCNSTFALGQIWRLAVQPVREILRNLSGCQLAVVDAELSQLTRPVIDCNRRISDDELISQILS